MTTEQKPRTEAGRVLLRDLPGARDDIARIEAEATRLALEDIAERVRGIDHRTMDSGEVITAVLALFSTEGSDPFHDIALGNRADQEALSTEGSGK